MVVSSSRVTYEELFTQGKGPGANLDRYFANSDYIAVLDGCTPKHSDQQGAIHATICLMDALVENISLWDEKAPWSVILKQLELVSSEFAYPYAARASGVIFSRHLMQILVIGDCWVGLDSKFEFFGHDFEDLLVNIRCAFMQKFISEGFSQEYLQKFDPGRKIILSLLAEEEKLANVALEGNYCFPSINGKPIPLALTKIVQVDSSIRRVVLASDGYPLVSGSLKKTEEYLLLDCERDPLRIGLHPGTKAIDIGASTYDDRTYVSFFLFE